MLLMGYTAWIGIGLVVVVLAVIIWVKVKDKFF
jgi:hypothetical protein